MFRLTMVAFVLLLFCSTNTKASTCSVLSRFAELQNCFGITQSECTDFDVEVPAGVGLEDLGHVFALDYGRSQTVLPPAMLNPNTISISQAVGDFDNDGLDDVLVPAVAPGLNMLHFSLHAGELTASPISSPCSGIVIGSIDLDHSGGDDLMAVSTGVGPCVSFCTSDNGQFLSASTFGCFGPFGGAPSLAVGDVNNDGVADAAVTHPFANGGTLRVFLGQGSGMAELHPVALSNGLTGPVALLDLDFDGCDDLLVSHFVTGMPSHWEVSGLLGACDGSFALETPIPVIEALPAEETQVRILRHPDLNNDGLDDLVISMTGTTYLHTRQPDGTFTETASIANAGPIFNDFPDLNGDGLSDVLQATAVNVNQGPVFPELQYGSLSVWKTDRVANYELQEIYHNRASFATSGDELIVVSSVCAGVPYGVCTASNYATVFDLIDHGYGFPIASSIGSAGAGRICTCDWDTDGHLDLFVNVSPAVLLMTGDGSGSFSVAFSQDLGPSGRDMVCTDLMGDSTPELIVADAASSSVLFFERGSTGGLVQFAAVPLGLPAARLLYVDVDADGDKDLMTLSSFAGAVSVVLRGADGWSEPTTSFLDSYPQTFAFGAFVAGAKHVAVSYVNYVRLYTYDDVLHTFEASAIVIDNLTYPHVRGGDVDFDELDELVVATGAPSNADGSVRVYSFAPQPIQDVFQTIGWLPGSVTVEDLNGDGRPDIVVPCVASQNLAVLMNGGIGDWQLKLYGGFDTPQYTVVGDFDGDGLSDIAARGGTQLNVTGPLPSRIQVLLARCLP